MLVHRRTFPRLLGVRRGLELGFIACVAFALWFALVMPAPMSRFELFHLANDHMMHLATFLALTFLGAWLLAPIAQFAVLMVGAAGTLELVQGAVGREMSFYDWMASSAGVAAGVGAFLICWHCARRWKPNLTREADERGV